MVTRRTSNTAKKYTRYTPTQLSTLSRQWQRKVLGKSLTPMQKIAIKREIKWIAFYLRAAIIKQVNAKLKTLRTEMAKHHGVTISSPKATSTTIKRLETKLEQIQRCARVAALIKLCSGLKVSTYKNPNLTKTKSKTTRTTTTGTTKYKRQAKALKTEISKLKQRNTAMKKLVAKFRKEVAQLQRHYGTFHQQKPRLVHSKHTKKVGQEVSNIVRFSNALSNAFTKQLHKVG